MQKLKNMSLTLLSALAIVTATTGVALVPSHRAAAIECAYLPQSICNNAGKKTTNVQDSPIFALLRWVLKALIAMVGIAAVGGVIWAGVLYATAGGGEAVKVKQSKTIITNVAIGLIAFGLMFVVLNWLIPGGVLG